MQSRVSRHPCSSTQKVSLGDPSRATIPAFKTRWRGRSNRRSLGGRDLRDKIANLAPLPPDRELQEIAGINVSIRRRNQRRWIEAGIDGRRVSGSMHATKTKPALFSSFLPPPFIPAMDLPPFLRGKTDVHVMLKGHTWHRRRYMHESANDHATRAP